MNIGTFDKWIKSTARARDVLVKKHGFSPELFVDVEDGMCIHLLHSDEYPSEWEEEATATKIVKTKENVKRSCIPAGLVLFEMPESQCNCSADHGDEGVSIYKDPIMMLRKIEDWEKNFGGT